MFFRNSLLLSLSVVLSVAAWAESFVLPPPDVDVVGHVRLVMSRKDETLLDIAREYGIGHNAILAANPDVDVWYPGENTPVVIPSRYILPDAPREGIVLNLPEMRLYYYPKPAAGETPKVMVYAVGIGRQDWKTPLGLSSITLKRAHPTWTPPESIRAEHAAKGEILPAVVPAGEDNPLGLFALNLSRAGYLIHGTNKPWGVGMRVSHGCVRLYPEGIEELFAHVKVGDKVNVINQPMKVGWFGNQMFLEFHKPLEEDNSSDAELLEQALATIEQRIAGKGYHLSEELVATVIHESSGLPVEVTYQRDEPSKAFTESEQIQQSNGELMLESLPTPLQQEE